MVLGDDLLGEFEHLGCGLGVERGGVLVEEEQLGLHQRGHEQGKRLALTAREQAGLGGEPVFKAKVQRPQQLAVVLTLDLADAPAEGAPLAAPGGEGKVLLDAHRRRRTHHRVLEYTADERCTFVLRQLGDVAPVYRDASGIN